MNGITSIMLLDDGKEAFDRLLRRMREAKTSIDATVFIWRNDPTGEAVARALLAAADRGVKVRIAKDTLGWVFERAEENKSSMLSPNGVARLWPHMEALEIAYGSPRRRKIPVPDAMERLLEHRNAVITNTLRKDHAKLYVFDDRIIIVSGMNIERKHVDRDRLGRAWRDYTVEIEGEDAVKRLRARLEGDAGFDAKRSVDFVRNDAAQGRYEMEAVIIGLLKEAKRSVHIEMAYLGDNEVTRRLAALAKERKEVTLLMPERSNLQDDLNKRIAHNMIAESGGSLKVALCKDMLHAKALIVDGRIALLGSANLNRQALRKVGELDVYTTDKAFVSALKRSFRRRWSAAAKMTDPQELGYSYLKAWLEGLVG